MATEEIRAYWSEWAYTHRSKLRKAGLCRCKAPRAPGKSSCLECLAKNKAWQEARRKKRAEEGRCINSGCRWQAEDGRTQCRLCLDKGAERTRRNKDKAEAEGRCHQGCRAKPREGQKRCDRCLNRGRSGEGPSRDRMRAMRARNR